MRRISHFMWISCAVTVVAHGFAPIALAAAIPLPTFCKDAAPILFEHCVKCHQPGEIASTVSFLSYDTARPWAKAIKEKVLMREMPPWPADPHKSLKFRDDPRLSQEDIHTLVAWVDAGAPKGNEADLPLTPKSREGWLHPKGLAPDAVISTPAFEVPATGEIPYVTYLANVPFPEDKWIAAIQVRPGNRAVVHHMAITEIELDEGIKPADLGPLARIARQLGSPNVLIGSRYAVTAPANPAVFDMLGVYTPGTTFEMYADGSTKLLRGGKNFYINFNIHYQTSGKTARDRSMIGLWFQPRPPKRQLFRVPGAAETIIAQGKELLTDAPGKKAEGTSAAIPPIPPNAPNYEVTGIAAYTQPVTIYQLQPHAHLRGKDFKYTVVYDDGREQTVLSVPKYDFRWQLAYELETPLELPAGSKLVVTAHYDNSVNNKYNPGPQKQVDFREGQNQSWDEMFTPFVQYSINSQTEPAARPGEQREQNVLEIVEVCGCLESSAGTWMVTHAGDPVVSKTQATTSVALKAAKANRLGAGRYQLLGMSVFEPSKYKGQEVAAKGVLIKGANTSRLNVTSLQMVAAQCGQ
jgi:hypothetical protein